VSASKSNRPRVYCAHPITTYGTAYERACFNTLAELLPDVELYDPAGRYKTSAAWRRAWPRVLASLDGLVVFVAEDGTIGAGCLREITDAIVMGLPLAVLEAGSLRELVALDLVPVSERTRSCAAWPGAGDLVTWQISERPATRVWAARVPAEGMRPIIRQRVHQSVRG